MRNVLARVPHKHKKGVGRALSLIFTQESYKEAQLCALEVIEKWGKTLPDSMNVLSEGLEDALQFFNFPELPTLRITSTNHLERLSAISYKKAVDMAT